VVPDHEDVIPDLDHVVADPRGNDPDLGMSPPHHAGKGPDHDHVVADHEHEVPDHEDVVADHEDVVPDHEDVIPDLDHVVPEHVLVVADLDAMISGYIRVVPVFVAVSLRLQVAVQTPGVAMLNLDGVKNAAGVTIFELLSAGRMRLDFGDSYETYFRAHLGGKLFPSACPSSARGSCPPSTPPLPGCSPSGPSSGTRMLPSAGESFLLRCSRGGHR
jgi:hypothetical protein